MGGPKIHPFRRYPTENVDPPSCTARGGGWLKAESGYGYACYMYQVVSSVCVKVAYSDAKGMWSLDDSHGGVGCGEIPNWAAAGYVDLPVVSGAKDECSNALLNEVIPTNPTITITVRSAADPLVEFYAALGSGAAGLSFGAPVLWPFYTAIVLVIAGVLTVGLGLLGGVTLLANIRATRFGDDHDSGHGAGGGAYVDTAGDAFNRPFLGSDRQAGAMTSRARGTGAGGRGGGGGIVWES